MLGSICARRVSSSTPPSSTSTTSCSTRRPRAPSPAASTSGINAKDAICLALTGSTAKTDDHAAAVAELRRAGSTSKALATTLGRLLNLKNKAQYQTVDVAHADAVKAEEWARKLVDGAAVIVPN